MRGHTDKSKLERFMKALGNSSGAGRVYLTGGGTALLEGWRAMTVDIDLKAAPEPAGFFEAIAQLKDSLDVNVELAAPDDFIPSLPGWQDRSLFIARHGRIDFFHFDPYSQALAKIERGHQRDRLDVQAMMDRGLVQRQLLFELFSAIEKDLIRFPGIDAAAFRAAVIDTCQPGAEI